jgi:selenocysteine lyase/cysteine desulfurase
VNGVVHASFMRRSRVVQASLAPYNTCDDIDALVASLRRIVG